MRNLLIITQKVDEQDDLLGFFVGWLREFSKHFEYISVIALGVGSCELPKNVAVYSCGKERGIWRPFRWARFLWLLITLIPRSSGIFAHMSPIFAIAAWPWALVFRKPIVLWYLHRSVTLRLKLANLICRYIATASQRSLNLKSPKVVALGHGIDTTYFTERHDNKDTFSMVSVGRISRIKNYETLIEAVNLLKNRGLLVTTIVVGRPARKGDSQYLEELQELVKKSGLDNLIAFTGFVSYSQIRPYYERAGLAINLAPTGGLDKGVLEAMATGLPVLVANEAFREYLKPHEDSLMFKYGDPNDLADKIERISKWDSSISFKVGQTMRMTIIQHHNLATLGSRIAQLYA